MTNFETDKLNMIAKQQKMEAIEALKTRRSCRAYTGQQISDGDLNTILECALNAPSGSNKQSTKIVVVQEPEKIKLLSALNAAIMDTKGDPFYGAPTICLIVAPIDPGYDGSSMYDLNPVKDGSLVIGAMQTAAFAIGAGSCWINRCKEMLELPEGRAIMKGLGLEDYQGVGCCILGYPAKDPAPKKIKEGRVLRY